ncbi:hypothetical protein E2320_022544 [Naja naja]|nr:hypothetical protein E2320_022544 [Naja naja]
MVVAVTSVLDIEAGEWADDLHHERLVELGNIGLFLVALQAWFEDGSRGQQAEDDQLMLKQKGWSAHD